MAEPHASTTPPQERFPVAKRGYERKAVDVAFEDLADRVAHAEATTLAARTYSASLLAELRRLHALEDELTTAIELARRTGEAIVADAREEAVNIVANAEAEAGARLAVAEHEAQNRLAEAAASAAAERQATRSEAERTLSEVRARLAAEAAEMEQYRLAIAAEASMLAQIEQRLGPRLSRAAARLVEVVDAPNGIGPFSPATADLVHFARLLQRAVEANSFDTVALEVTGGNATLRLATRSIDLRQGDPMVPIGSVVPAQANASNISSMALS